LLNSEVPVLGMPTKTPCFYKHMFVELLSSLIWFIGLQATSPSYYATILEGYKSAGIDPAVLREAAKYSARGL
ncbi:MAG: hypothetical protein LBS84_09760, partial [Clostridiales bacterium]|nr:hypothetical protein [Clostridiales bacterium]